MAAVLKLPLDETNAFVMDEVDMDGNFSFSLETFSFRSGTTTNPTGISMDFGLFKVVRG